MWHYRYQPHIRLPLRTRVAMVLFHHCDDKIRMNNERILLTHAIELIKSRNDAIILRMNVDKFV